MGYAPPSAIAFPKISNSVPPSNALQFQGTGIADNLLTKCDRMIKEICMEMKRLSMTVAGAAFTALLTVAVAPVQAAPLDFNFTTESGATGSFTLDTDIAPAPELRQLGARFRGILYPNAVSNFSFLSPQLNVSGGTADYQVAPELSSDILAPVFGFPFTGVLSGAAYPSGCSSGTTYTCRISAGIIYNGNLLELPKLSDDPNSYPSGSFITLYDPTTAAPLSTDRITNLQVVRKQPIPESDSSLGILAFGIAGVGLLLKRNSDRKKLLAI
ncbi:hypothetical protein NIES4073_75050 [Kalymmatonema gypsitolerans NIES-4073]|nr:hypothetical protein NIES4073_75050 [Scytonema sp. NIES-4073]